MTSLRPSQVETLRAVGRICEHSMRGSASADALGMALEIRKAAAQARLERLRKSDLVSAHLEQDAKGFYHRARFSLTQLGREALEGR
jgi:predicted ArsR family transcriptional regulator